jgi:hypothetical protein
LIKKTKLPFIILFHLCCLFWISITWLLSIYL